MEKDRSIIKDILSELAPYEEIEDEIELIQSEILNSLSILFLVTQIEEKYNIVIDESKVVPENFRNINAIVGLLEDIINKGK